jgi:hypothetical protein
MADVPVKIFRSRKTLVGVIPSIPSGVEGEPLPPVNPPGSNPSGGGGNDSNAVHYNAADGKDEIEKQQARDNIDVFSKVEVKEVTGELAQLNTPDKSNLVSAINQKGQYRSVGW